MTTFPRSPKVLKGAIIGLDPFNPLASIIIFQYNPDTMQRTLTAQIANPGSGTNRREAQRLSGPPQENITLLMEIDAADQLEKDQAPGNLVGVYPVLASLEMLLYPKSAVVIANEVLAAAGIIELIQPEAPLTLFVWGISRVLPVRLSSFSITEEAYDTNLNPVRAKVNLGMRVLNYQDLGLVSVGGALFMAHQVIKEVMATINGVGSLSSGFSFSASANLSIG
jgi:hypothetical protein